jgi:peptide/nickel transport system substrate-binding protein
MKDVRVRQAINYAFDRKGMLTALQGGVGEVTNQMFPPNSPAFDKTLDDAYPFDPGKAKKLLADAGYGGGLTLAMPNSTRVPAAQWNLVAQQLADVGITVQYTDPGSSYLADLLSKYPAGWLPIGQDQDWAMIELLVAPRAQFNPLHVTDDTVAKLIERVRTGTPDEQHAAAKELNKVLVDQAWFAPWYRQSVYFATDSKTSVPSPNVSGYPSLYDIRPAN